MIIPERRLLIFAALIRLIPAALIFGTEDVYGWYLCGKIMASGGNPYDIPVFMVWPPVWPVFVLFAYLTSDTLGLPFPFTVKLLPIAADIILTTVLLSAATRFGLRRYFTAAVYAFNPVAIYTSAIHGNFDAIPALFCTLAIISASRMEADPNGVRAGTWLGIGAAFKTFPLLILPALMSAANPFRRRLTIAAVAVGIFLAALLLPWPLIGSAAIAGILRYRGFHGWWGITAIEFLTGQSLPGITRSLIFYGAMGAAALLLLMKRAPPPLGALFLLLTFYLATPGFGLQYLLWIVPIAIIADQRRALVYSGVAGLLILFELMARPFTGYVFESIRLLPHSDFARNYGGPIDHRYTAIGRLILWLFFLYWWVTTLVAIFRGGAKVGYNSRPAALESSSSAGS